MVVHAPPPELELLLELDELVEPVVEPVLLLEDELELLLELELLEEPELPPVIVPAEAVRVTRSSLAPSSRRSIRKVCEPAPRLPKIAGVMLA
jgi:hypothetical protein